MQEIVLHLYQADLRKNIYKSWEDGNRNVLAVSGTGSGKSVIVSEIALDGYKNDNMPQVIMAHRNELVTQMSEHIANRGIPHRIIGSDKTIEQAYKKHYKKFGKSFIHPTAATSVIGVDTLISRQEDLKNWAKQIHRWTLDEAHHCIGNDRTEPNKWGKAVHMFSNAYGLGVTATPQRADGQGLGINADGVFNDMVLGPPMRFLIENNFLSDYQIACPYSDYHIDENKRGKDGDFTRPEMRKASKNSKIVGDVVENYCKLAYGRKAIVFATDVETANEIADKFNAFGVRAACVHGKSNPNYREQCIDEFALGSLSVLVNVDLFDEGFDVPSCDVVIMARPTASLGKYLQMVGRALRYMVGKIALIIDHVSNILRHKLPDYDRVWSLERKVKKQRKDPDEIPLKKCKVPECNKPYEAWLTACPHCGAVPPLPEPRSRSIEMVEGDLILLDRETLARMRESIKLENPIDIANRVSSVAGAVAGKGVANRQTEKIEAQQKLIEVIEQWAGCQRAKGFNDSEIHRKFYLTTGLDVLSSLAASKSRKDYEEMSEIVRSWYE